MKDLRKQQMGERIAARMKELDFTDVEVGEYVGISKVAVGKWRKGETEPTGTNLTKLVHKLGVTAEWITTGKDTPAQPVTPALPASSSSVIVLMDNLKEMEASGELTPAVVAAINGVIDAVKSTRQAVDGSAKQPQTLDFHALQAEAMNNHGED